MKEEIFMILTFESTHKAIHFEHLLKGHFAIEMIPTPREVTASCGLSLKFECEDFGAIQKALEGESKEHIGVYLFEKKGHQKKAVERKWG